jgi:predicted phosphodiesterase
MHIPPRTDTIFPHGTARNYETQSERLRKILARHKVDLLLSSHEHTHLVEDWEGIKVIVSGGAGAPMFPFQRFGFFRIDLEEGQVGEKFLRIREQHGG